MVDSLEIVTLLRTSLAGGGGGSPLGHHDKKSGKSMGEQPKELYQAGELILPQWQAVDHLSQVSGSALSHTMDLRKIQEHEDWSPDCENLTASVTSNLFNFTMRSVEKSQLSSENVMIVPV